MFTHPRQPRSSLSTDAKTPLRLPPPGIEEYPQLFVKSFSVVCFFLLFDLIYEMTN